MRKFAAFDIDGTLVRWQLYHAVVDQLAKGRHLGEKKHSSLHRSRMVWKRREHPEAFKEYEMELIKTYEESIEKLSTETFDHIAKDVAKKYKDQVYRYTRELTKELKEQGYFLVAISGSHEELVREVAKNYKFDAWVGTQYQRKDGKFTGKKFVASIDKKTVLNQLIEKYGLDLDSSIAVGDSASDIPMLEVVKQPIAFNPDRQLLACAKNNKWKIVVERKNVIYELESTRDGYKLAKTN